MNPDVDYSLVIPVYNSESTLNELHSRIKNTFLNITDEYEIIFVDDFSIDRSWEELKEISKNDPKVKIIHLAKNFGQHSALVCGLSHCKGNYVIMLDDDLQNPPEEITKLIEKIHEGYSVVYGKYITKQHSWIENICSSIFKYFIHFVLGIPKQIYISNFVICKHEVIKNVISMKTAYPQITALIANSAPKNKIDNIEVLHDKRKNGKSNYNSLKHFRISLDLFINHSTIPLQFVGVSGILVSILSILYGASIIIRYAIDPTYGLEGWTSLMVATTFLSGSILVSIGIIGEYLRRILVEISHGQPYVISEIHE